MKKRKDEKNKVSERGERKKEREKSFLFVVINYKLRSGGTQNEQLLREEKRRRRRKKKTLSALS